MYRFKWPFRFSSRSKQSENNVENLDSVKYRLGKRRFSLGKITLLVLVIAIVGINGLFWLFRASRGGLDFKKEGMPEETKLEEAGQPREWEIDLNEQHIDEQEIQNQYNIPEMSETDQRQKDGIKDSGSTEKTDTGVLPKNPDEVKQADRAQETNLSVEETSNGPAEKAVNALVTMAMPTSGKIVTQYAVDRLVYSKTLEQWGAHYGIDIAAEIGDAVKAVMEGAVIEVAKNDPRLGVVVVIDHGDGIKTLYGNLASDKLVQKGKYVKKNQVIGAVGNTAPYESEDPPHLHFEVFKDDKNIDPQQFLPKIN
jgi:murein DD-endopeptidase MepM/ murein hydrolase activator NlpD